MQEARVGTDAEGTAAAHAAAALELAREEPERARDDARRALELAAAVDDPAAVAVAERALGLAARTEHDLAASLRHLRRAVRIAERHGLATAAAQARVSLFGTLALRGEFSAALAEADRAAEGLRGVDRARLELQRATVLMLQGVELDEALAGLQRALPPLRRAGERSLEATVLENRGLVHCYRGVFTAAEADLRKAEALRRELGQERLAATVHQNLGFVAARRGDLPAALAWFDRADRYFRAHGLVDPMGLRDRCEALLQARLVREARATAEAAVESLDRRGLASHLAEARVMLAEAALLDEDAATADRAAERAARAFARQHRPRHRALASHLRIKAAWQAGERSERLLRGARRNAAALEASGWLGPAQDAHLLAGRLALALGHPVVARRELERASRRRRRGLAELRIRAYHADALLRLAAGDRAGAERALHAGMRLVERHRALLASTDLRVHASAHATELAELGLRLGVEAGDPDRVLRWAERWRAGSLSAPPVRPPGDGRLQGLLGQLRQAAREVERAALEGRRTGPLLAQQTELEARVRDLARHAPGSGDGSVGDAALALDALGPGTLVEFVAVDGQLHAVTVARGERRLTALGPIAPVLRENEALRFALSRLAHGRGSEASRRAAETALAHAAQALDGLLLGSLHTAGEPLLLVPTGPLHAVPWSALPSCADRPVAVAPAARLWQRAATRARPAVTAPPVLAAGPRIPWAEAEIDALRTRYPDATTLVGEAAQAGTVAAALDGAGLGHLVAHGHFRTDNPLFSCLDLADGPLTVYDLEALRRPPRQLVLSACDTGLSDVQAGDELRGLVAALLTLGTDTVVAPVTPVADAATRALMVAFHEALAAGLGPARALTRARAATADTPEGRAAAAGFVCFGAP